MSSIYLAGAVAVLGLIAQKSPVNKRVPVGQPYDVVLTASADFPNPLQDVDLTGVLRGPNGQELVVPGFWDGGRTFRLRFTLTAPGTWFYTTVSSDAGLDAQSRFVQDSGSSALDPNDYSVVEYLVARYAAYSNVVWCAGSPASTAGAGSRAAVRGLVRTLDPYFSVGGWQRPMFASCGDSQFKGDRK